MIRGDGGKQGRRRVSIYWVLSTENRQPRPFYGNLPEKPVTSTSAASERASTRRIIGYVYFTFVIYLAIGLPLAILPAYVHFRLGFSAALAGLVISIQYIATFLSRPWAGHISDHQGAKVSVIWGMCMCTGSGALLLMAGLLHAMPWISVTALVLSRLALGVGESLGSTGATLWGITAVGQEHTAKVISYNGICTYGATALGAPLGVLLENHLGLGAIGFVTMAVCAASVFMAVCKHRVPVVHGERLSFASVLGRVAPHGIVLALGGLGYSVLATFVTLFYVSRHWDGAALCLTAFGVAFIAARIVFIHSIERWGGFPVALVCLAVESAGVFLLWQAHSPWTALMAAAITGFGFSLVFPAMGVEAVRRVPEQNRGTALGVFTGFADVSFFLVGPAAGAVIGVWGYASAFLFALICVVAALGITATLARRSEGVAAG
jgi:MFS family permease